MRHDDLALRTPRPYTDDFFPLNDDSVSAPGRPIAFATDTGTRQMRVFRTPSSTESGLNLVLRVARLPVTFLATTALSASPEVPDEYHMALADYAAGRCLRLPNVDGKGKADGKELIADFNQLVREARQDRQRAGMGGDRWAFASMTA